MVIIKFSVKGQRLQLKTDLRKCKVTSDTINYFKCQFEFDSEWDGFDKRVYFKNASFNITKPTIPDDLGYCYIPWEVLAHTGVLLCNVTGIKYVDGEAIRLTAGPVKFFVHNPGSEEQITKHIEDNKATIDPLNVFVQKEEGTLEPDYQLTPTLTEYEQYIAIVKRYRDEVIGAQEYALDYLNLRNKPQIEHSTLIGDKTYDELNLNYLTNLEIESILS